MYDIHVDLLIDLDLGKYVDWLFNHKAISTHAVGDNVWRSPTNLEKDNFIAWREFAYKDEIQRLNFEKEGSPLPEYEIIEKETARVCGMIDKLYPDMVQTLLNGWVTSKYYEMGSLIGKIDYLKYLHNTIASNAPPANNKAWIGDDRKRNDLFNSLKNSGFISDTSVIENFMTVGGLTHWISTNVSLYYLVENIKSTGAIKNKISLQKILEFHFRDSDGKQYNKKTATARKSEGFKLKQSDKIELDNIISRLKK